jgi:hypothetical protein
MCPPKVVKLDYITPDLAVPAKQQTPGNETGGGGEVTVLQVCQPRQLGVRTRLAVVAVVFGEQLSLYHRLGDDEGDRGDRDQTRPSVTFKARISTDIATPISRGNPPAV